MSLRRVKRSCLGSVAVILAAGVLCPAALAAPPTDPQRHHIGFGFGFTKLLSDDLKNSFSGTDPFGNPVEADFTNAGNGFIEYRLSLSPMVDLAITSRATASTDDILDVSAFLTNSYFGPGVRINGSGAVRPYAQANLFVVSETLTLDRGSLTTDEQWTGFGFGVSAGVDIKLSKLLSLPVEANYVFAEPEDNVSGAGFSLGLAFNWGSLE